MHHIKMCGSELISILQTGKVNGLQTSVKATKILKYFLTLKRFVVVCLTLEQFRISFFVYTVYLFAVFRVFGLCIVALFSN